MLIRGGRIVQEHDLLEGDLLVRDGRIAAIGRQLQQGEDDQVIDAKGCYVFPGFIDPHTHFEMTNALTTTADDYHSGSVAALYGGTTTVINFATAEPGMGLMEVIEREKQKAERGSACDYQLHVEMVDVNDRTLSDIGRLKQAGVRSCKAYMAYGFRLSDKELYETAAACRDAGMLLEVHCENGCLLDARLKELVQQGRTAVRYKAEAHPAEAEAAAVYTLGQISRMLDCPIHVVHLSSRAGLEALRLANKQGARLSAETCPQYLYLDESLYQRPESEAIRYVCAPPFRREVDRAFILEGLAKQEITTLATDHCAYRIEGQKDQSPGDFRRVPGGLPGVEERASLCYTRLLASGLVRPSAFAALMATNAAKLYGLYPQKGVIKEGSDADLCIYDPAGEATLHADNLHSRSGYTAYEGITVKGRVCDVLLRGQLVISDGQLLHTPKGRYLA